MNWRIPPVGTWGGTSLLLAALSLPLFATAQSVAAPWQGLRTVGRGRCAGSGSSSMTPPSTARAVAISRALPAGPQHYLREGHRAPGSAGGDRRRVAAARPW